MIEIGVLVRNLKIDRGKLITFISYYTVKKYQTAP